MKPEKQRIAIAEECGWHISENDPDYWWTTSPDGARFTGYSRRGCKPQLLECIHNLPDYLNDLNAMHEAEKVLDDMWLYRNFLYLVTLNDPKNKANEPAWATAAQRAEAFLRTVGRWEE